MHAGVKGSKARCEPRIGEGTEVGELARVVGDVTIDPTSEVSDRAAIRADEEGHPITIGANANIEERVTFHSLEGTDIEVGDDLSAGGARVAGGGGRRVHRSGGGEGR